MKWGIVFASTGFPDPESAVALAESAEASGFESLWSPEHIIMSKAPDATPYRGMPDGKMDRLARRGGIPDPLIWFAFVASRTSRIRFGTGVLIVPEHQPVVLAKTVATLDHLCGGRLMLGIGVGELPEEYGAVGMAFGDRGQRMDEYIEAMRTLWREDEASFAGQHVAFDRIECRPWPPRRTVPLFIGGASRAASAEPGESETAISRSSSPVRTSGRPFRGCCGPFAGRRRQRVVIRTCSRSPPAERGRRPKPSGSPSKGSTGSRSPSGPEPSPRCATS